MSDEATAIREVIQIYLDGLYEGDGDKLERTFHPTSALTFAREGALTAMSRDAWIGSVRSRPSPQAQGLERGDEILLVDQSSPTTAFVKVRCQIPPRYFVDYLNLLKVDGRWQVAQKVFAVRTETASA